jgi:OFA family oxalate/formate antiporter-like MFS transporter
MNSAGMLVINSSANIAVYYGAAAGLGLAVSVFNGVGRPVAGMLVDKLGRLRCMLSINVVLILSGVLLLTAAQSGGG